MNNRLIIVGAGGHGRVVADNAVKNGYKNIAFVDDAAVGECEGFPIIGTTGILKSLDDGKTDFVIAIGSNDNREELAQKHDVNWVVLIHPSAQIGISARIGAGTVVMACAVVNAGASVGKHCIVNTGAVVEHDNIIEDFAHISPKAALGGTVSVGKKTQIGLGAVVKNNIKICDNCTIGAGSVVVKNIETSGTYVGVPAELIQHYCRA